ncbi:MAG: hypothetical protein V5B78_09955 [Desulfohalobiaceae bacterium]
MPCIKAETIYTGKEVIRDAYLHLDGERITGWQHWYLYLFMI